MGGELVGDLRPVFRIGQDIAARDVEFIRQSQRDRLAGAGAFKVAVGADDARDLRGFARSRDNDLVAGADGPARDRSGEAAKIEMRAVDPLHGEAERLAALVLLDVDGLEKGEQRRPPVPGRVGAFFRDIVAVPRRDRNRRDRLEPERRGESLEIGDDPVEARGVEAGKVDLVDGQHDMPDAEQGCDRGMAAGLRQKPLARVDQQDREVGAGGGGRHVAGILFVARRVGDDEGAARRRHIAIGDVDGDALFALGLQPVDEKGEVDIVAVGAVALRIALQSRELVVEDEALLIEQAADQRRFAVVDGAAGDQPQRRRRGAACASLRMPAAGLAPTASSIRNIPRASSFPSSRIRRDRSGGPRAPTWSRRASRR